MKSVSFFGINEEKAKPICYIGETEDCFDRQKAIIEVKTSGIMLRFYLLNQIPLPNPT